MASPLEDLLSALTADRAAGRTRSAEDYLGLVSEASTEERRLAWTLLGLALADDLDAERSRRRREGGSTDPEEGGEAATDAGAGAPRDLSAGMAGLSFGGYRIREELGRGGMGLVFLAEDPALGREVALKLLPPTFLDGAAARERFRREARVASRLDHPNLASVLAFGDDGEVAWIAMPYVPGRTLAAILAEGAGRPALDWRAAVTLVETLARAMHHAHEAGVVHRDLKPANVMVKPDGTPVILDFGLARDLDRDGPALTRSGDVLGTPWYMAPEQVRGAGRAADRRLDLWALGVILFEMVAGRRPFDGASRDALYRSILQDEPPPLRRVDRRLPRDLEVVVATALAREPDRRYSTALALAEDLAAVRDGRAIRARPPGPLTRAVRFARRRPALVLLLLLALVGGPVVSVLATRGVLEDRRLAAAAEDALAAARAALGRHDPRRARELVADARALVPDVPGGAAVLARCRELEALERIEALALDEEVDPDGRLARRELAAAASDGDGDRRAILELHVLARTEDGELRRARAEALAPRLSPEVAAVLRADLDDEPLPEDPGGDVDRGLALALAHSRRGRHREALSALERVLERAPGAHALAWAAAEEASRMQAYDAALGFAARARAVVSAPGPRRLARYGVHLRRAGLEAEALAAIEEAAARAPEDVVIRIHLGNALAAAGKGEAAAAVFDALLASDPELARAWCGRALLHFDLREFEAARAAFVEAVALAPRDAEACLGLGNSLVKLRRPAEAEPWLRRSLAVRPDFPYALNSLATALRDQGRLDAARETAERALALRPDYADGIGTLASILHREGALEAAETRYRQALALGEVTPALLFNLAILIEEEKPAEAIGLYRRFLEREPDDAAVLVNLANLLASADAPDEAVRLARRACTLAPDDVVNWNALATAQDAAGQRAEAVTSLRRAVAVAPLRIEPHANLMLLQQEDDALSAVAHGELFLLIDPGYEEQFAATMTALRAAGAAREEDHPLVGALALDREPSPDPERVALLAVQARALPEGEVGSRAWGLRRGALTVLARLSGRLGRDPESTALRAEALAVPAGR